MKTQTWNASCACMHVCQCCESVSAASRACMQGFGGMQTQAFRNTGPRAVHACMRVNAANLKRELCMHACSSVLRAVHACMVSHESCMRSCMCPGTLGVCNAWLLWGPRATEVRRHRAIGAIMDTPNTYRVFASQPPNYRGVLPSPPVPCLPPSGCFCLARAAQRGC